MGPGVPFVVRPAWSRVHSTWARQTSSLHRQGFLPSKCERASWRSRRGPGCLRSHQFHPHTRRRNHQVPPQQNQGTHKHHPGHRTGRSKSLDTNRSSHSRNPRPCCICRHSSRRSHQGNHQARRIFHQKPSGYVVCMLVQCGSVCPKPFLGTNCTCRGIYGECVRRRRWTKPSTN